MASETHRDLDHLARCPNCGHPLSMFTEAEPGSAELRAARVISILANWWFPAALLAGIAVWLTVNIVFRLFEPYPMFMLATLAATLSTIAALQGPLILLTQRRATTRDRARDRETYVVAANAEVDLHEVRAQLLQLTKAVERLAAPTTTAEDGTHRR